MESKPIPLLQTRRQFIRQAACAALGTTALTSAIRDLRFMNAAVAQSNVQDYKALVCIFLAGGNDSNNLIVPTIQAEYDNYATIRTPVLAIPQSALLPITSLVGDNHDYGLHPSCPELQTLFGEGKLAVMFNTGTLLFPITRAQYQSGAFKKPPQLFSHSDQVTQWQTSIPDQPPVTGWGGRCADLMAAVQPNAPISLSVTLSGSNTFEVGNKISQYSVSTSGAIALAGVAGNRLQALTNILGSPYPNMQAQAYANVAKHSIDTGGLLNNAIAATASASYWTTPFPTKITPPTGGAVFNSSLAPQLQMAARLIEAGSRSTAAGGFGMRRQIFFCQVGGYDLHTNQTPGPGQTTIGSHANLLAELSQSMIAFQRAMEQLGLSKNVTAFTASDFGRTLPSNGQGSDHGWGSHHLIVGGAVKGQQTYGKFPTLAVNGPDDTSTGRWIPTTAIDQYFATIASWFGVDSSNIATVFPNVGRFATSNLGFL
ncbi:MAG TPA: DUF1501 domain-containing protein [Candidatus Dormibacteraeota bacterium]|nr:DUF1501 domain-containing protein [Candidatus Dormibacteraeota bacterium]